jgi:hypothetical protein
MCDGFIFVCHRTNRDSISEVLRLLKDPEIWKHYRNPADKDRNRGTAIPSILAINKVDSEGNMPGKALEDLLKEYARHARPREIEASDSVGALFCTLAEKKTLRYFDKKNRDFYSRII